MGLFQDLANKAKQRSEQQQILAQPSIMDEAPVDPQGTEQIARTKRAQDAIDSGAGSAMGTIKGPDFSKLKMILGGVEQAAPAVEGNLAKLKGQFTDINPELGKNIAQEGDDAVKELIKNNLQKPQGYFQGGVVQPSTNSIQTMSPDLKASYSDKFGKFKKKLKKD